MSIHQNSGKSPIAAGRGLTLTTQLSFRSSSKKELSGPLPLPLHPLHFLLRLDCLDCTVDCSFLPRGPSQQFLGLLITSPQTFLVTPHGFHHSSLIACRDHRDRGPRDSGPKALQSSVRGHDRSREGHHNDAVRTSAFLMRRRS
jgi:hypothetical protein